MQTANVEKKGQPLLLLMLFRLLLLLLLSLLKKGETLLCMLLGLISMFVLLIPSVSNM